MLPLVFLAAVNASQQLIVGFDEFMKVQAWSADIYSYRDVIALWPFFYGLRILST